MSKKYNIKLYKDNILETEYKDINVLEDKEIKYFIDSTKNIIGDDYFIRENEDFRFFLDFTKNEANYLLKEKDMLFDIKVTKALKNINEGGIDIIYKIETSEEEIKVTLEKR